MLIIEAKTRSKFALQFIDKKLIVYNIVGFVNQKQKTKAYASDNETTQT